MQQIEAGFDHSVHQAQQCFREVLKALSEPGTLVRLAHHSGFAPLNAASSQVIMSLCDQQTAVYLSPALAKTSEHSIEHAVHNLAFHNSIAATPLEQADFAVICGQQSVNLQALKAGCDSSPEHGATLLVQTEGFNTGPVFRISGPGIKQRLEIQLGQLSESLIDYLLKPSRRYPLGLDFMFCHQQSLVAISRTTKLELI
ncbi:phosphonate C-P lyase system protein PhnH [Agarivorans sp. TSD2052]|uniref:phosphonate C-P lyase system protein PhnH n=1 Tax=Agarivorans sp. TSD2052 TaxID=2937286 RepID=UPI00200D5221|nr:phosphonate C-P lyase system protein PhnH [Agarivorans sp. TSD2052]UPW17243.1 phosphonate C-P lyase system protein PhnH [Agarivorans sp. TSD2052]